MKLFQDDLPFIKGNFHTHTTCSDGRKTPAEAMQLYQELGYDFLCITDHRKVTKPEHIPEGLLMLPGVEMDLMLSHQAVHLLGIGVDADVMACYSKEAAPQQLIDGIVANGGRAILAHPAWSLNTPELVCTLHGLTAAEVYNSVSFLPYNGDRGDSSSLLDVYAANGQVLPLVANDDTHFYGHELGKCFTMVQAEEKTLPAILNALDEGRFFATQGPMFHQVEITGGKLHITCSPVEKIVFYSDLVWVDDRTRIAPNQTEATYSLIHQGETFVRCQLIDGEGKSAQLVIDLKKL